jgi:hypothetical protein
VRAHITIQNDTITIIPLLRSSDANNGYSLTQAVTVMSLTNRTWSVLMDPEMLVMEFKDLVSETVGPPVFEIRLIFVNKDEAMEKGKACEMLDGSFSVHWDCSVRNLWPDWDANFVASLTSISYRVYTLVLWYSRGKPPSQTHPHACILLSC